MILSRRSFGKFITGVVGTLVAVFMPAPKPKTNERYWDVGVGESETAIVYWDYSAEDLQGAKNAPEETSQ